MSDADPFRVSPSGLATYATCPRQFEYDKVWDVETPEESRRYMDRGLAYHGAIEDTCDRVAESDQSFSDAEIQAIAREAVEQRWATETDRAEYESDAQYDYDRRLTYSAIESYFESEGLAHARNSVAREAWIQCAYNDVNLHGRVDHIVRTDDGLEIIDYKGSLNGIVSGRSHDDIEGHHDGETYNPDILKSVFQAAAYIEGVRDSEWYEPGMDIEFTYYALMADKERTRSVDGIEVSVSGRGRSVGWIYEAHQETIWEHIRECYEGIRNEQYTPEPWAEIQAEACEDCAYQAMCGDYLGVEVAVDE